VGDDAEIADMGGIHRYARSRGCPGAPGKYTRKQVFFLFHSKKRTWDSPKKDLIQTKKGMREEAGKDGFSRPLPKSMENIFMNKNPSSSIWGSLPRRLSGG
jgi:hypothetical protein